MKFIRIPEVATSSKFDIWCLQIRIVGHAKLCDQKLYRTLFNPRLKHLWLYNFNKEHVLFYASKHCQVNYHTFSICVSRLAGNSNENVKQINLTNENPQNIALPEYLKVNEFVAQMNYYYCWNHQKLQKKKGEKDVPYCIIFSVLILFAWKIMRHKTSMKMMQLKWNENDNVSIYIYMYTVNRIAWW